MMYCMLRTPREIAEDEQIDVFGKAFDSASSISHQHEMYLALWNRFHDHFIGSRSTQAFIRLLQDKIYFIGPKYDNFLTQMASTDLNDLTDLSYNRATRSEAIEGTDGDVTTTSHTGEDTVTREDESLPQTQTPATPKFLNGRTTDKTVRGITDTVGFIPNTKLTEECQQHNELAVITFDTWMKKYPDVLLEFTREFDELFVNMW